MPYRLSPTAGFSAKSNRPPLRSDLIRRPSPDTSPSRQAYPHTTSKSNVPHTRCTTGGSSGRPDRGDGMYPLWVGVTMGIHKLTAGSGYDYLTRQVAALDATEKGHVGLASYYSGRGE